MQESTVSFKQLSTSSKDIARRLLTIGENRLELLTVEMQEERDRLLHAILMAFGVAAFGLLACLTLTAAIAEDVRSLKERAQSLGSIASAIAMLGVGLAAFRRGKTAAADAKPSWLHTILKGTGLVSTLWAAFRTQRSHHDETSGQNSRS